MSKEAIIGSAWFKGFGIATGAAIVFSASCTLAQITPDTTLPNNSRVDTVGNTINIEGGTQAGSNLFHSFQEFSLIKDTTAYFRNAADVQNIISRVTGNSISNIDGLIRANGTANLFLINPNGIVFGQNARLDIGGSFFATSANVMKFADGFEFSSTNPQSTPLLTINVPVGLQYGSNAGSISIKESSLQVNPGRSLALVGGNVSMDGGKLIAPSGHVELGGVKGENTVELFPSGDFFGLNFAPGVSQYADVSLTNQAEVNVLSSSGGSIAVNAGNLNMSGGSQLVTGISGIGLLNTQAGDVKINATGITAIADSSKIANEVAQNAVGNSGNININANSLSLSNNSFLATSTNGQGNAGNVTINTDSLSVFEGSLLAANTNGQGNAGSITINAGDSISFDRGSAYTDVGENGKGKAGNFNITTQSLSLNNGTQLIASTKNEGDAGNISINTGKISVADNSVLAASANGQQGNAGNITINARDRVLFDRAGQVYANVTGTGSGGEISITGGSLSVLEGSVLAASANGQGNAGNITINARDTVSFSKGSRAYTDVTTKGNGGDINITASSLFVTDDSFLASNTKGEGNSGNITINARDAISFNKGSAYTNIEENGKGQGGNFNITTQSLSLTNGAELVASTKNEGDAGNISISTGKISVTDNSFLAASANGQGNAGNININARKTATFDAGTAYADVTGTGNGGDININTESLDLKNSAYLFSKSTGNGDAGNIKITTNSLTVIDKSILAASANGQGNAGNITINASDRVLFERAGQAYTDVTGTGNGGEISITGGLLSVTNASKLNASTSGVGNGGNLNFNTGSLSVTNESFLASSANGQGNAGNITIDARDTVSFDYGAKVYTDVNRLPFSSTTEAIGDGGDIKISSGSLLVTNGAQLISNTQGEGDAGNITINTGSLSVTNDAFLASSANGQRGNAGKITIDASDRVLFDRGGRVYTNVTGRGNGGDLSINTDSLSVTNGSILSASTSGVGDAGNITFNTGSFFVTNNSQVIASTSKLGNAGALTINTDSLFVTNESFLASSANGQGNAGNITIDARNTVSFENGAKVYTDVNQLPFSDVTQVIGDGGNIKITSESLSLKNGAQLISSTQAEGNAGNIIIKTGSLSVTNESFLAASGLTASSTNSGKAGNLTVDANSILLDNRARINADTQGGGGNIILNSPLLLLRRGSSITTNARGNNITGGDITIDAQNGFIVAVPSEDSDIRADSQNFRGGKVTIKNTAGIFGIQSRLEPSRFSDITVKGATPELGGTVQINQPDVDPSNGLVPLAIDVVDVARLVDDNICAQTANSSFTYTGRGGLPPSPNNTLNSDAVWEDWRLTAVPRGRGGERERGNSGSPLGIRGRGGEGIQNTNFGNTPASEIVEAQGWVVNGNGDVILVAHVPMVTPHKLRNSPSGCQLSIAN